MLLVLVQLVSARTSQQGSGLPVRASELSKECEPEAPFEPSYLLHVLLWSSSSSYFL